MRPPEPIRVTGSFDTFDAWRALAPGASVPAGLEPPSQATGPLVLPTAVATAFAVHGEAETVVTLRLSRGELQLAAHGAIAGDLAAVVAVVQHGSAGAALDWAQVALLSRDQAAGELLVWLPDPPTGPSQAQARMSVIVTRRAADGRLLSQPRSLELARWVGRAGSWSVTGGQVPPGKLRAALQAALLGHDRTAEAIEDR